MREIWMKAYIFDITRILLAKISFRWNCSYWPRNYLFLRTDECSENFSNIRGLCLTVNNIRKGKSERKPSYIFHMKETYTKSLNKKGVTLNIRNLIPTQDVMNIEKTVDRYKFWWPWIKQCFFSFLFFFCIYIFYF